jgi:3-oxoacyl-[acyl-carrier-protein] synthase-1
MSVQPLTIESTGLVTSVGLSAAATCAAVRGALSNHSDTGFIDSGGERIRGAQVPLGRPWRGEDRLIQMLRLAMEECLAAANRRGPAIPLLLCVAEPSRAGRLPLGDRLLPAVAAASGMQLDSDRSAMLAFGRVGPFVALSRARHLLADSAVDRVLIAATDSLLVGASLEALESAGRLLTSRNADGFVPGEGAGALLVARTTSVAPSLVVEGLGFSTENATIDSEAPLRGDGLAAAIQAALMEAGLGLHAVDFRISDNAGEQYYFKESALAVARTLRQRKSEFDLWHPADCIGEIGAASTLVSMTVAQYAGRKGYGPGPRTLLHAGLDTGERSAAILSYPRVD